MDKESFSAKHVYGFLRSDIDGIDSLAELALDMRWSWNHATDGLWKQLDSELWMTTHNPWIILQTVSRDMLETQLADPVFKAEVDRLIKLKESAASSKAWFQQNYPKPALTCAAYFSMEFMLSEALPIYTGGLGNVAGDQLKAASDLGVPVVAIGLLYQQGYFHQEIDKYGNQQALFPYNDPGQLPITPLRLPNGEWLRLKLTLSGYPVWLRIWQVHVGRVKLYLLDSNDPANLPFQRGITSQLYGGEHDIRIQQEIILGIGGFKLLKALGIKPEVCHMNEGHAAFLVLERANDLMKETGASFEVAMAITRAGNLFTTHTAVAAGFDQFSLSRMQQFLGAYCKEELRINFNDLMAIGRCDPYNTGENFNMAYLAIRGSGRVNGVSRLHGKVSRHLFEDLFPRWPVEEIPIGSVTNGVHMSSWDSEFSDELWTQLCGKERWRGDLKTIEHDISKVTDDALWQLRTKSRNNLVNFTRKRFERQLRISGQPSETVEIAKQVFNPNTLTLGFARRFVPYKRPNLLLHDPERFIRILTNPECPVQLIISGKAPPFDESGKDLIRQWVEFIQQHNLYRHVIFLSDYDMLMTEHLVRGVDVWINTPRRPWEACGTSGMKVLVNGGINLSELDGWWAEAYTPEVGWAIGYEMEHGNDPATDAEEAVELYNLLEQHVVPEFYSRNKHGIPARWVERMRKSMSLLTPRFSANRAVREYTENFYLPAAANYIKRAAQKGDVGKQIMDVQNKLKDKWGGIKFGEMKAERVQDGFRFHIHVMLNGINPGDVLVELYAEGINGKEPEIIIMEPGSTVQNPDEHIYLARVKSMRSENDYTVRIVPNCTNISVPLENNLILWQR